MIKLLFILAIGFTTTVQSQTIIYVDSVATGANNGTSWTDAFIHLQDALGASAAGDSIWVATGTYYPDQGLSYTLGDREASFKMKNGVAIYGGFNGTETALNQADYNLNMTLLSGEITGPNTRHVVHNTALDSTAILDGFIITAGFANNGSVVQFSGGGMYNDNASPTIDNCTFVANQAINGAALYGTGGGGSFTNCEFKSNIGLSGSSIIYFNNTNTNFLNCKFTSNSTSNDGAVFHQWNSGSINLINCYAHGNGSATGFMSLNGASATITNCTFSNNNGSLNGGAFTASNFSSIDITNSILWNNGPNGQFDITGSASATLSYSILDDGTEDSNVIYPSNVSDNGNNSDLNPLLNGYKPLPFISPTIDQGDNLATQLNGVLTDLEGKNRVIDNVVDIGAYERVKIQPHYPDSIIYVKQSATGNNDGSSWGDAFTSLNDALYYYANVNDSAKAVWVANGTYKPTEGDIYDADDRTTAFSLINNLDVHGGFAGNESTSFDLHSRDFLNNESILSGDIGIPNLENDNSLSVVSASNIDNAAFDGFTITKGFSFNINENGGGMFIDSCSGDFLLSHLKLVANKADEGGGIYCNASSLTLSNIIIDSNRAWIVGGGMASLYSDIILNNVSVFNNQAKQGGGILISPGSLILNNTTITHNRAGLTIGFEGGGVWSFPDTISINNSVIYGNSAFTNREIKGAFTSNYSVIKGFNPAGIGNLDATSPTFDPLFVDTLNWNYHLQANSPLLNAGADTLLAIDDYDLDGDGDTLEYFPLDLDRNERINACNVDIGAYEYQNGPWGVGSEDSTLCYNGNNVSLIGNGESLLWFNDIGLNNLIATGDTLINNGSVGNYTYYVTDSTFNCSRQITDTVLVTINALPTPNLGADTTICSTDNITLNGGVFNGYVWSNSSTSQTFLVDGTITGPGSFNHWVTTTDNNGCMNSDSITIHVSLCTGISALGNVSQTIVYPNPTNGNFSIDLGEIYESKEVSIFNLDGKLIRVKSFDQGRVFNMSINEPAGVYLLIIESENKKAVIRLVKE